MITTSEKDTQVLSFKLNGREFAIPIDYVQEIASSKNIILNSQEASTERRIINHKGKNIPIVDIADQDSSKVPEANKDQEQFIIILNHNDKKAGILADEVSKIVFISNNNIKQPEGFIEEEYIYGISRINNNDLFLINPMSFMINMNKDYIEN